MVTVGGAVDSNYDIVYVQGTLTINPAPLTIAAVTDTKTYDGTAASSATPTYSTLYGGDTVNPYGSIGFSIGTGLVL